VPLVYGAPQGRSATFSNAQSQQTAAAVASFLVYRVSNYEVVSITNELLEATKDNAGAFVDECKLHMDTGFRNITNDLASDLFGDGTGTRAQIAAAPTTSGATNVVVFTITNAADTTKLEVGMLLVASATDGSAPSADTVQITGIDRINGIVTGISSTSVSSSLSGNWAALSFISVDGDLPAAGASTTGSFLKISGMAAWIPTSVASTDSFWNVNRSADQRLSGVYQVLNDRPIEEALIDLNAQMYLMGASSDYVFINPVSYASLEKSLGAKIQYVDVKHDEVDISFEGIQLSGQTGKMTVIADRNCPAKNAFMLQLDTWKLKSLGKMPHVLTYGLEGLEGLRVGTADALEIRIGNNIIELSDSSIVTVTHGLQALEGCFRKSVVADVKSSKIGESCDANTEQTIDCNWLMAA